MTEFTGLQSRGAIIGASGYDQEIIDGLGSGEMHFKVTKDRSGPYHKRFFALLNRARAVWTDDIPYQPTSQRDLLEMLKLECGYVTRMKRFNGEVVEIPRSISYAAADQLEFQAFAEMAVHLLEKILGHAFDE